MKRQNRGSNPGRSFRTFCEFVQSSLLQRASRCTNENLNDSSLLHALEVSIHHRLCFVPGNTTNDTSHAVFCAREYHSQYITRCVLCVPGSTTNDTSQAVFCAREYHSRYLTCCILCQGVPLTIHHRLYFVPRSTTNDTSHAVFCAREYH